MKHLIFAALLLTATLAKDVYELEIEILEKKIHLMKDKLEVLGKMKKDKPENMYDNNTL